MEIHTYTVTELGDHIAAVLDQAFYDGVWVQGEISNLNRSRNGHVYFDLVEATDQAGQASTARISVALYRANRDIVNRILKRAGGVRMNDGVQVRISGMVSFFPGNGRLTIRMTGIDPMFTLGQMTARREQLLRDLAAADLLDRNGRLPFPTVPLRVGLITSDGSAAYADFSRELEASACHWRVTMIDTQVQGSGAEAAIASAIATLGSRPLDVIAVVRGGGARGDLVVFDSEAIAQAIARCAVPVITGIGHETDDSVADRVAHQAFKTPTACAAALVERVRTYVHQLDTAALDLRDSAIARLAGADGRLVEHGHRTVHRSRQALRRAETAGAARATSAARSSRRALRRAEIRLDEHHVLLSDAPARRLRDHDRWLDGLSAQMRAHDPARVMARGWSVTRREGGRVVRSIGDVGPGDLLVTSVADGTIHSTTERSSLSPDPEER